MERYSDLSPEWQRLIKDYADEFGEDVLIQFYEDDDTDEPDVWADGKHLAVIDDPKLKGVDYEPLLVWPINYDGWADPRAIGWPGVIELIKANQRI